MGKKKATTLKKDTKLLLEQHIAAATTPAAPAFTIDAKPSTARVGSNKKQRAAAAVAASAAAKATATAGGKRKRQEETSSSSTDMDTTDAASSAAAALFENDSDDEPTGTVVRARFQRSAHKQGQTELVSEKEAKRLKRAAATKAEAEAAVAARPAVFDVWATSREEDLVAGIKPETNERGFRVGRMQQRAFRHHGEQNGKEHVVASVLPAKIHEGASFHPDAEKHQELLRTAYEKDEAERAELAAIRSRFNVPVAAAEGDASAAPADDSWMDEGPDSEPRKNPASVSTKFSKTKRNQMAKKAANAAKHAAMVEEKNLAKFVARLPVLVAELKKEEKLNNKERKRIEQAKIENPDRKPKLGRYEEEELFPDVALTEELPENGSMRKVKPSMHVIKEQFSRFQERHLIETRKKVKAHKGFKAKSYERFKDEPTPAAAAAIAAEAEEAKAAKAAKGSRKK